MRQTTIALTALIGLAAAGPASAQMTRSHETQTDRTGSASPDGAAASSNYTGKGQSGAGGANVDHGPSQGAGSPSGKPNSYTQ